MLNKLCDIMELWILVGISLRLICIFRKKGTCKYERCPFRKQYTDTSFMNTLSGGCTKCPPTEEEKEIYYRTPDGILEYLANEDREL